MHPGQFNQVGAVDSDIFLKTNMELSHHADILDAMNIDNNGVIIVHVGGIYGDKKKTMARWISQFNTLPDKVKRRLVVENCEKSYSAVDCLAISKECNIPVVFDFHHYYCWKGPQAPISELMPMIIDTWKRKGQRIVMHVSEQAPDKKVGAHSDYVETIPSEIFDAINTYNVEIDLEIEAKMKEQAVLKLYTKYMKPKIRISVRLPLP
jgi:UV DNA damage endonuclease